MQLTTICQAFDRLLRPQESENMLFEPRHRETLLHLINQSRTCHSGNGDGVALGHIVCIEDYVLAHSPTEYDYQSHSTIWEWMKQYRTRGPMWTPRFLFPDKTAGPDLLFVLERDPRSHRTGRADDVSRILVVVQV